MNLRTLFWLGLATVAAAANAQYSVFAAETQSGSLGGNTALYGGVQQYDFATVGGAPTLGPGLSASQLHDPAGLEYSGGKVYVGNRFGNTTGQGSVQAFDWDGVGLSGGATIASAASPSDQGWHGFTFGASGDLFVSTVSNGVRRFRDSGSGYADIGGLASGQIRDVMLSPDGAKLYQTTTGNQLLVTEVLANGFGATTNFTVGGADGMHQMAWHNGSLFVTGFNSGTVHQILLDGSYNPTSSNVVLNSQAAIGITFSPDGAEMYVSGHTTDNISRYLASGNGWVSNGSIATGHNMGYLTTVPEPGTLAVLGLGIAALIRRRRRAR